MDISLAINRISFVSIIDTKTYKYTHNDDNTNKTEQNQANKQQPSNVWQLLMCARYNENEVILTNWLIYNLITKGMKVKSVWNLIEYNVLYCVHHVWHRNHSG